MGEGEQPVAASATGALVVASRRAPRGRRPVPPEKAARRSVVAKRISVSTVRVGRRCPRRRARSSDATSRMAFGGGHQVSGASDRRRRRRNAHGAERFGADDGKARAVARTRRSDAVAFPALLDALDQPFTLELAQVVADALAGQAEAAGEACGGLRRRELGEGVRRVLWSSAAAWTGADDGQGTGAAMGGRLHDSIKSQDKINCRCIRLGAPRPCASGLRELYAQVRRESPMTIRPILITAVALMLTAPYALSPDPAEARTETRTKKLPGRRCHGRQKTGRCQARLQGRLDEPVQIDGAGASGFQSHVRDEQGDFVVEVHRDWARKGPISSTTSSRTASSTTAGSSAWSPASWCNSESTAIPSSRRTGPRPTFRRSGERRTSADTTFCAKPTLRTPRSTQVFINFADNSRLDAVGFARSVRSYPGWTSWTSCTRTTGSAVGAAAAHPG